MSFRYRVGQKVQVQVARGHNLRWQEATIVSRKMFTMAQQQPVPFYRVDEGSGAGFPWFRESAIREAPQRR